MSNKAIDEVFLRYSRGMYGSPSSDYWERFKEAVKIAAITDDEELGNNE